MSGPMTEMLTRLTSYVSGGLQEFKTVYFPEATILDRPIEEWPHCEALIAFFSAGFPLHKAQAYQQLRRPLVFNDLQQQEILFDRRLVYSTLEQHGVPVPTYTVYDAAHADTTVVDEAEE